MTAVTLVKHTTTEHAPAEHRATDDRAWAAVRARDRRFDGRFVYAVRTTGVYCRPSCGSRRPKRANVLFFADPASAEAGGFRPCRRCHPHVAADQSDVRAVRRACALLDARLDRVPTLERLGAEVGLSPWHLQRVFKRVVGVSPREYVEARRAERLRVGLREEETVSRAVYAAGYGSGRAVYERARSPLGMTPATYRRGGRGLTIAYTVVDSPLGRLLVAATERGVCSVKLGDSDAALEAGLRSEFPQAELARDPGPLDQWVAVIVRHLGGDTPRLDVPLDVRATAFQWRVWTALRAIPYGTTRSYADVARAVGAPRAVRAVARACAMNPVALVVPCHRVVRGDGDPGGYRWGIARKTALLEQERTAEFRAEARLLRPLVAGLERGAARTSAGVGETVAGRFRLLDRLGEGGMGIVYRALDTELDEIVALKLLRPEAPVADPAVLEQVAHEVRLTRRITHPNVVRTFELGQSAGARFLVMEYVEGVSLDEVIARRGSLPPEAVVVLGMQLCRALAVVHARGVVHRDVKPQNVLLTAMGEVKLADFGIAALRESAALRAGAGSPTGTPLYMAPEQLLGEAVGPRADLYAVGVVLHECLTGRVPFEARTPAALAAEILRGLPARRPSDHAIPSALGEVLGAALAADAARRPPSAAALHDRLALIG
jgi:AraC family transcriptional regulator of adaptative response/methylated-DNA-[protein]-cysteine methyltransferase